ncbi:MAG: uroporphyrinogen decarboxylase family protein, partial [Parachlamydiaceae bacterium]
YISCLGDFSAISLSEAADIKEVRKNTSQTLQGNFDSRLLLQDKASVVKNARKLLDDVKKDPAYIFNLGHGILPETPLENVYALAEEIFR